MKALLFLIGIVLCSSLPVLASDSIDWDFNQDFSADLLFGWDSEWPESGEAEFPLSDSESEDDLIRNSILELGVNLVIKQASKEYRIPKAIYTTKVTASSVETTESGTLYKFSCDLIHQNKPLVISLTYTTFYVFNAEGKALSSHSTYDYSVHNNHPTPPNEEGNEEGPTEEYENPVGSEEEECVIIPEEENVIIPEEECIIPEEECIIPEEEYIIPEEEYIIPEEEYIIPEEEYIIPEEEEEIDEEEPAEEEVEEEVEEEEESDPEGYEISAMEFGINLVIEQASSDYNISKANYTTTLISSSQISNADGILYKFYCNATHENKSLVISTNFTVYYLISSGRRTFSSFTYKLNTVEVTTPTNPTTPTDGGSNGNSTNTTTPTDDYVQLTASQIASDAEAQNILDFATSWIIEKGYNASKIPVSDYEITQIASFSRKVQSSGINFYKGNVNLEDDNGVKVNIQFTISIQSSTFSKFVYNWYYYVSSSRFLAANDELVEGNYFERSTEIERLG